jgi:hypothetical protein
VEASRDGIPFRSRGNQFVYQICLLNRSGLDPCRTFQYRQIDRLGGRYPSFCGIGKVYRLSNRSPAKFQSSENVLVRSVETAPLTSDRPFRRLRIALAAGVAWVLVGGDPADAAARGMAFPYGWYGDWYSPAAPMPSRRMRVAPSRRQKSDSKKETGFGELPKGPLQIVVSIDTQTVTLFSNGVRVAQGPVSTGVPGRPTPMGVFSIIEKDRYHHSNLYSNAPMPYMQRITWSGVALHEGVLPGYPASHGCIRIRTISPRSSGASPSSACESS